MEFDFEKHAIVEDVTTVPEKYRGLYVEITEGENAGKHQIGDFAKGIVEAYTGTNKALGSARGDKKTSSDESAQRRIALRVFEDLASELGLEVGDEGIATALQAHIDELVTKIKGGSDFKANVEKIKAEAAKQLEEAMNAKDKIIGEKTSALETHLIGDVATRALTEAKGSAELLLPHITGRCKVVEDDGKYVVRVVDPQGDFRSNGKGGWMGVSALVEEMKGEDKFARAFESEAPGGGGTKPGSTAKPAPHQQGEMTSTQKIASGLAKGQYRHGAGTGN
jgi:hypothetical protein